MLAAVLFLGFLPLSSLATAQLQQQQEQQQTTTIPPSSSLSITTIPPLTPQEQEQQNRLQSTIAATTRDLNETEKEVSGVVFTPRWSDVVWVNANSIAVFVAYCLPGEFADSGQEVLGGFGLEVLESYAVDLPQGFMAWMAVLGNQEAADVQQNEGGRRLPAALGVICASDLNRPDTRILSPEEQQQINNVISQFTTIQNTQITNIDQVINMINNVTEPTTGEQSLRVEAFANVTEAYLPVWVMFDAKVNGGTPPYHYSWWGFASEIEEKSFTQLFDQPDPFTFVVTVIDSKGQAAVDSVQIVINRPPTNGTEPTTEEQPLRAEIITNATEAYTGATIKFDASITGGASPYSYSWSDPNLGLIDQDRSITLNFFDPGTFTYILTARDSKGQTVSDTVQIVISERPGGVLPPPETGGEGQPPGTLLPGIAPGGEGEEPGIPPTVPEEGEPTTGGGGEDTGGTPPTTEEEEPPSPPDNTGGEGEGGESPPPDEEPTTPPEGGG
jgi:hypothetical protein